jgi:hypothetical protein
MTYGSNAPKVAEFLFAVADESSRVKFRDQAERALSFFGGANARSIVRSASATLLVFHHLPKGAGKRNGPGRVGGEPGPGWGLLLIEVPMAG